MLTRRKLLQGMMLAGGFCLLPFGRANWALAAPEAVDRHLIVILLPGAADGLSIVTPYMEQAYYRKRSGIALAPPNHQDGVLNLDGFFGLHPSLKPLMPFWQNRSLAFIHASGSPSETRSHFEAQDIFETAMLNTAAAQQGWMNGLAQILPDNRSPVRALSFSNALPKIFQGKHDITIMSASLKGGIGDRDGNLQLEQSFNQLYGTHPELGERYRHGTAARETMMQDLQMEMESAAQDTPGIVRFAQQAKNAAEMIRRDQNIQLVFLNAGNWDTHVNQGNAKGHLANILEKFGESLAALVNGLGPAYQKTAILIMSEFGRTVAENGDAGTDHGHGSLAWLMGGGVKGGKVWGRWPGLEDNQLYQGRDLAVTTDFRAIIGSTLSGHFGMDDRDIAAIIPGYARDKSLNGIIA